MNCAGRIVTLSPRDYDAVLFDLDGVLTDTASVHAKAWKKLFDAFLERHAKTSGKAFVPFDIESDYRRYVDGKPRHEGVMSFLHARGIDLPMDAPNDAPSVHALGQLKDEYFKEHLNTQGVETYQASIDLVRALRENDVRTGVVSSSNNCAAVLEAVGIADLFDVRVDGRDIARLGLAGKPAPDSFLEAARRIGAAPARTVVVEDAIAGVAAGKAGDFGAIIGVDRTGQSQALREAGADVVVQTLSQVRVDEEPASLWELSYEGFDPLTEGTREALCALGNGYVGTRGAAPWAVADGVRYPGTYFAGGYNRVTTDIADRAVENEALVNFPNWLSLQFRLEGGDWFDEREVTLMSYRLVLNLRHGVLQRELRFEDAQGRRTALVERRFVGMHDMHLCGLEITLTPENWAGRVTMRAGIDGRVVNDGAQLYRKFNNRHLEQLGGAIIDAQTVGLLVRTDQSLLYVAEAARTQVYLDGAPVDVARRTIQEPGYIAQEFDIDLASGKPLQVEKLAALHSSRDPAISEPRIAACKTIARAPRYEAAQTAHSLVWQQLWRRFDIHLQPAGPPFALNVTMLLRLNMLHLLQAASFSSIGLDIGVPARGWTGEAYEGHIFWDELYIFPFLNHRTPEITRSLLMYRYRRLDEARAAAKAAGYRGAMFPWQSGSDGQEETQELNLNPRSGRWMPDNSYLQRHVGSAIAYNVWQYLQVTDDMEFAQFYGAELLIEIARFWASITTFNEARDRYEIHGVMGPDEFHDAYPGAERPGLKNNAYTNVMAVWTLCRALDVLEMIPYIRRAELIRRLGLTNAELELWKAVSRRMYIPFHGDGIISQFEGYEKLAELDWEGYRLKYGNIGRLELILEAEGDSANRYKAAKQADVLMLFYLFSADELSSLFAQLGYALGTDMIARNVAYYDRRSSHGSTLSRVVHAWVMARSDRARSMRYFAEALQSDVSDIQGGTTREGIHLGAMAGTVDLMQRVSTGIEVTGGVLRLDPRLPVELSRLDMRIRYRGHSLDLRVTQDMLTVRGHEPGASPIRLQVRDEMHDFDGGSTRVFALKAREDKTG